MLLTDRLNSNSISRAARHHEVMAIIEREKREISHRSDAKKIRSIKNRLPHDARSAKRDLPNLRKDTEE